MAVFTPKSRSAVTKLVTRLNTPALCHKPILRCKPWRNKNVEGTVPARRKAQKTLAVWVNHRDGSVLIGKIYGPLRPRHSVVMAEKLKGAF
jgi:hypothetical protein